MTVPNLKVVWAYEAMQVWNIPFLVILNDTCGIFLNPTSTHVQFFYLQSSSDNLIKKEIVLYFLSVFDIAVELPEAL